MISAFRWSVLLRAAVLAALVLPSACAFTAKQKQAQRQARLHRQQDDEAAERNTESKADSAANRKQLDHDTRLRRLQSELAARGDPDSLAASALFERALSERTDGVSLDLAARAVAGAPERSDLALLQLQLCESVPSCNAVPLEAHLRQLDPQNGASWTYALQRAERANDGVHWREARDGLARSQRITLYWNQTVSRLANAADKAGFDSVGAMAELIGVENIFLEQLPLAARACSAHAVQQADVLAKCRRIAAAYRASDRTLLEAYGSTLAVGLWPRESAEGQEIAAQRIGLRYRADLMTRYNTKFSSAQATRMLAADIARSPTEQAALRALMVELGLKADPPANWPDPNPAG